MTNLAEHERLLFGIAYRMLGDVAEAHDVVQDAYLRWSASDDEIADLRAWLVTVVTRLCLDRLKSARARREVYVGPWLPEPLLTDEADPAASAELADTLSLAFLVVLESLSPAERAVFLLHDVFGYPYDEVARMLDRSVDACRQLGTRARRHVRERRPRFSASPDAGDAVAEAFLAACAGGDLETLLSLLADDVVVRSDGGGQVQAARRPVTGADNAARFVAGIARKAAGYGDIRLRQVRINGAPGAVIDHRGRPAVAVALDIAGGVIVEIDIVVNPDKLHAVAAAEA